MKRIAITPEILDGRTEPLLIRTILESGWDRVHLRHPAASRNEIQRVIEAIPQELHGRIVLHGHFDLVNYFNLGGLHLNHRCQTAPANYHGALSKSCHSIDEVNRSADYNYVMLSPIFDSISKLGYRSAFTSKELSALPRASVPVIALGGIDPSRIASVREFGFDGFAMLGALPWEGTPMDMAHFASEIMKL